MTCASQVISASYIIFTCIAKGYIGDVGMMVDWYVVPALYNTIKYNA